VLVSSAVLRLSDEMNRKTLMGVGLLCLVTTGCAASRDGLRKRASYDLECPADQLVLTDLERQAFMSHNMYQAPVETVGVQGCGKKSVYSSAQGVWHADRVDNSAPSTPAH
jgi:hypothetical protein